MSEQQQHTPGPWEVKTVPTQIGHAHKIEPVDACLYVDHRGATQIDAKTATALANARLMAAAPDLLNACQKADQCLANLMKAVDWGKTFDLDAAALNEALLSLPRAITKATGKAVK